MRSCEQAHKEYNKQANKEIQIGSLPSWMHVNGRVAWHVFQGPYSELPKGWNEFMKKARKMSSAKLSGPPGDVYLCDPTEHSGDEKNMLTILWAPLKA